MIAMGYFAYCCKQKYYRQFLPYDVNPSEKGLQLADTIPRDCTGFKDWVADRITMFENAKIHNIDDTRKVVQPEDGVGADDLGFNVTYDLAWKFADCYIEWTYVIDLDNVAFTIHLRLDNMPPGLENYSYRKGGDLPGVPLEYLSVTVNVWPTPNFDPDLEERQALQPTIVLRPSGVLRLGTNCQCLSGFLSR
ncbi:unnamed protein product [Rhizoctonia solani]|uniref:Uncharacterized protein n=1 Tax=Rhizoctonia solani TaxID=456999 RepID=A0A8H3B1P3_9AGAM|nr:unnamed protein product [Rhizoctonia solani]